MNAKPDSLPEPDLSAQQHSRKVFDYIAQQIHANGGSIAFNDYMESVLYAPGLGYYSAGLNKFGSDGDFITAPELSSLFGRSLAIQAQEIIRAVKNRQPQADILEVGAGSGKMAADILLELKLNNSLPEHYFILELSADLQQRQRDYLRRTIPEFYPQIHWLQQLPQPGFKGVIIANELLDAMPVHLLKMYFDRDKPAIEEAYVKIDKNRFSLDFKAVNRVPFNQLYQQIQNGMTHFGASGDRIPLYLTELNLNARYWIQSIADLLDCGGVLLIDYGYRQQEYYHPQRNLGTLRCHYRHHVHNDPFYLPGLQDITAHVNFSDIAAAGTDSGLTLQGYTTQANFLIAGGLNQLVQRIPVDDVLNFSKMALEIKKLTLPTEMGELFKVLYLSKNLDVVPSGFSFHNMAHKL